MAAPTKTKALALYVREPPYWLPLQQSVLLIPERNYADYHICSGYVWGKATDLLGKLSGHSDQVGCAYAQQTYQSGSLWLKTPDDKPRVEPIRREDKQARKPDNVSLLYQPAAE
jgi:hypothetical protein